jgi:hypothetical protein
MFEKPNANVQVNHDNGTMWVFYKEPDVRNTINLHELIYGGALTSYEVLENEPE